LAKLGDQALHGYYTAISRARTMMRKRSGFAD
jgi:hypothetical protein